MNALAKYQALTHYTEQARIAMLEEVWPIYLENAPEMQPIRAALAKLK